jgi:hypothetical protein
MLRRMDVPVDLRTCTLLMGSTRYSSSGHTAECCSLEHCQSQVASKALPTGQISPERRRRRANSAHRPIVESLGDVTAAAVPLWFQGRSSCLHGRR